MSTLSSKGSSLFFDLAGSQATHVPALYLSEQLVRLIGSEVCTFRRNAQASYRFVDTAYRFVGEIRGLIEKVLSENSLDAFSKWTKALKPLENVFRGSGELLDTTTLAACRIDLDNWKATREKIQAHFKLLTEGEELKDLGVATAEFAGLQHDDQSFVDDLVAEINAQSSQAKDPLPKKYIDSLQSVSVQASKLANLFRIDKQDALSQDLEVLLVQSMMATYGWGHFAAGAGLDKTTLKHLRSEDVCGKAKELMDGLMSALGGAGTETQRKTPEDVNLLYIAFINLVFGKPEYSCLDMMQLLSAIGRAYYTQALTLIMLCDEAIKYYNKNHKEDATGEHGAMLSQALEKTLDTMNNAILNIQSNGDATGLPHWKPYKIDQDYDNDLCTKEFQTALAQVIECMGKLGITESKAREASFQNALKDDKQHIKSANKRMESVKPESKQGVDVTVTVCNGSRVDILGSPYKVRVPAFTLLSAVEWGIRRNPDFEGNLRDKTADFELEPDEEVNKPLSKSKSIGSLADSNQSLALFMIASDMDL
ncbi:hypothetical protein RhiJN_07923 [Ceratobasidium sp. AG-Ba]|nr:hypothetical protein RhiJN_07923 [Ceratobasidium sp. AG-Ba]QRW08735.1 hypothetical protein RhiLY_07734 [Ceratobasidium sp. AG-Ba]